MTVKFKLNSDYNNLIDRDVKLLTEILTSHKLEERLNEFRISESEILLLHRLKSALGHLEYVKKCLNQINESDIEYEHNMIAK